MSKSLAQMMADLEEQAVLDQIRQELESGGDPMALFDACREGIILVGKRYEAQEYFVADLLMAAAIFKQATQLLAPSLKDTDTQTKGQIVFGTVLGDVHDIGKDLVVSLLRARGFEVHDLGVNVPPEQFVAKLKETGATVLGLSGLITTAYDSMRNTVTALAEAGMRDSVKVMIGGGMVNEEVRAYTGADAWGRDANMAISLCQQFLEA